MTLKSILAGSGGVLVIILTVVQIAPININPWSALAKKLGKAINAQVLEDLAATKKSLDEHIKKDDARRADDTRTRILAFNRQLMRGEKHTREEFWDILAAIDRYHTYCNAHPTYPNERAVHAIKNIGRVYDERQQKNDFLQE